MSVLKDLSRIVLEVERARYPELGEVNEKLLAYEQLIFVVNLLAPKAMVREEMSRLDTRRNIVVELAALSWIPKTLLTFQLKSLLLGSTVAVASKVTTTADVVLAAPAAERVNFAS